MASGLLTGTMTRERIAALPADDWRKEKNANYQEPLLTPALATRGAAADNRRRGTASRPARWRSRGCCATRR